MPSFQTLYVIKQLLGFSIVVLTVTWVIKYMGVVWDLSDKDLYNWHSIFMVLGMVYFYGNSILVFRAFKDVSKMSAKIAHAVFHASAIVFISLGLAVEFIQHSYSGEADMYSLHSWVGMTTIVIFVCQFIFGFLCYLSPALNDRVKACYLPIHVFFGIVCFIMVIATCLIGFNQNARFNMDYNELPSEGILINIIGMLLVVYGILVVYLATSPSYKRPPAVVNVKLEPITYISEQ